ncbi:hypothetical protein JMJ77_0000294, partial [Colletotrichum scovillei]
FNRCSCKFNQLLEFFSPANRPPSKKWACQPKSAWVEPIDATTCKVICSTKERNTCHTAELIEAGPRQIFPPTELTVLETCLGIFRAEGTNRAAGCESRTVIQGVVLVRQSVDRAVFPGLV